MRQCKDYEDALSSDCACCDENCTYRKGGNPIAMAFMILSFLAIIVLVWVLIVKSWCPHTILDTN